LNEVEGNIHSGTESERVRMRNASCQRILASLLKSTNRVLDKWKTGIGHWSDDDLHVAFDDLLPLLHFARTFVTAFAHVIGSTSNRLAPLLGLVHRQKRFVCCMFH